MNWYGGINSWSYFSSQSLANSLLKVEFWSKDLSIEGSLELS